MFGIGITELFILVAIVVPVVVTVTVLILRGADKQRRDPHEIVEKPKPKE